MMLEPRSRRPPDARAGERRYSCTRDYGWMLKRDDGQPVRLPTHPHDLPEGLRLELKALQATHIFRGTFNVRLPDNTVVRLTGTVDALSKPHPEYPSIRLRVYPSSSTHSDVLRLFPPASHRVDDVQHAVWVDVSTVRVGCVDVLSGPDTHTILARYDISEGSITCERDAS